MREFEFRDVSDGDVIPIEHGPPGVYWPTVVRWFCPSLNLDEAGEIYEMGRDRMTPLTAPCLRALILEWAATK